MELPESPSAQFVVTWALVTGDASVLSLTTISTRPARARLRPAKASPSAAQIASSTSSKVMRKRLVTPPGPPVTATAPPKGWRIVTLFPATARAPPGMPPRRSMAGTRSALLP